MANTDLDNDTTNGNQYGITYTIGFTQQQQDLLSDTARSGQGQYYTADNAEQLTTAFQEQSSASWRLMPPSLHHRWRLTHLPVPRAVRCVLLDVQARRYHRLAGQYQEVEG